MLKIVHFHPNYNMAKRFVIPLINFEKKNGIHSQLIVSKKKHLEQGCLEFKFNLSLTNLFLLPLKLIHLCFFLNKLKPDIIISHNSTSSLLPLVASVLLKIKHKIYFNHGVPYKSYTGVLKLILYLLEYLNCKMSDQILTVSSEMKSILLHFGNNKIDLINNGSACGIDLKKTYLQKNRKSNFRKKYNLKRDDFIILYVGRPVARKGFKVLLNLWDKGLKSSKDTSLFLCGCNENDVKKEIKKLPKNIFSLGFVDNIEEIYENSDVLILPSFHEGFPYAVLEALAANCIVVGNNVLGIKSIIKNNFNGFLVTNNDISAYIKTINFLKSNKKIRTRIANQGFLEVKKYSRVDFLLKYKEYLNKIVRLKK